MRPEMRRDGPRGGIVEEVGIVSKTGTFSGIILFFFGRTADKFFRLAVESVGSAKKQLSRIENGLEQSNIGAGNFSRMCKATSLGRVERG